MNEPTEAISAFDITLLGMNLGVLIITYICVSILLSVVFNLRMAVMRLSHDVGMRGEIDRLSVELSVLDRVRDTNAKCNLMDEASKDIMTNLEEVFLNQAAFSQSLFDMHAKVDSQSQDRDTFPGQ